MGLLSSLSPRARLDHKAAPSPPAYWSLLSEEASVIAEEVITPSPPDLWVGHGKGLHLETRPAG